MTEEQQVGFVTMGQAGAAEEVPSIGIGMLGYAFMGKAHSNALKKIAYVPWPPPYSILSPAIKTCWSCSSTRASR